MDDNWGYPHHLGNLRMMTFFFMLVYQRLTHKSHGNLQISGELREVQLFRFLKQHVEACRVRHPPEAMAVT